MSARHPRLRVAPPRGGQRTSDWLGLRVITRVKIAGKPIGSAAQVWYASPGHGLGIRFDDGTTAGGVTEKHIERL